MASEHLFTGTLGVAILISIPPILAYWLSTRPRKRPFPFLKLPAELRDLVYDKLLPQDGVTYPAQKQPQSRSKLKQLNRLINPTSNSKANGIILTSQRLHHEFQSVMSRKSDFTFYVDHHNYQEPALWNINSQTLQKIRKCELRFITTPVMMGVQDPHFMPKEWALCERVCEQLRQCERLESVTLHIRPITDPLWNPLWVSVVWYHASQAFKAAESVKFDSIRFSLDSWTPSENHLGRWLENQLRRSQDGQWTWECVKGHFIANDPGSWQSIRDFCGIIYEDCHVCHPPAETATA